VLVSQRAFQDRDRAARVLTRLVDGAELLLRAGAVAGRDRDVGMFGP
jgi:hypothetical protein